MNIHDLKGAEGAKTASKRVGRGIGSGTGKTSTRGHAPARLPPAVTRGSGRGAAAACAPTSRAAKCL